MGATGMDWDAWFKLQMEEFWDSRLLRGRITAPLHINLISIGVRLFGGTRTKIQFDLFERRNYAFGILNAADMAKALGVKKLAAIEFGVGNGGGLLSMCRIASAVQEITGVEIEVVGFDSGVGMPAPVDYRDHCEDYHTGDFRMDVEKVKSALPANGQLVLGDIATTVPAFLAAYEGTIGFMAVDVDYYSSSVAVLQILDGRPDQYLPVLPVYFDDVLHMTHNPWCGELLAIADSNEKRPMRKLAPFTNLRQMRVIKDAQWIRQMYALHVLDHAIRQPGFAKQENRPVR
jgi:hypothetical protein